ncbi:hypothetical protein CHCC20335_3345 [Bacillus paralicheniformis]|nr:hypothetical protein CHCC20335_3345 [Bacillus paralicheniformis]
MWGGEDLVRGGDRVSPAGILKNPLQMLAGIDILDYFFSHMPL